MAMQRIIEKQKMHLFTFLLVDIELMFSNLEGVSEIEIFDSLKKYILEKIKMDAKYLLFTKQKNR